MAETGHYAILAQLIADGVTHIFGNPGTVEQGFLDAMGDRPALHYVLTLQESVAIYAADAYARATNGLAVAQIHSSPGLGNAIGALYQAHRGHSPLLVLGGDAGIRYQAMDAQMAADLVGMARPVTKWATMVQHPTSLLRVLRRAIKVATTPPCGPVYVCVPEDVLDAPAGEPVVPTSRPSTRVLPDPALVDDAARLLAAAQRPTIYIGDGVYQSGATAALVAVAEALGADVWGVDCGEINMPYPHPLWRGQTGHMFGSHSLPITTSGDVNLVVGTYMVPEVFPELGGIFAPGAKTIHVDLDAGQIAKNHPADLGVVADPKLSLDALLARLDAHLSADRRRDAAAHIAQRGGEKEQAQADLQATVKPAVSGALTFAQVMAVLAPRLPDDALIFDEALTNSPALTGFIQPSQPGRFFQTRGGSLGTGLAGGLGLQAAAPERTVLAVSGDGGAMYVIQALWSAVRHNLPVKYIVCNNRSYRLLQANLHQFWSERGITARPYPLSFDLSNPPLNFAAMAQAYGLAASRVETADQIGPAIDAALGHAGPYLIDVVLDGDVHPDLVGVRCGQ